MQSMFRAEEPVRRGPPPLSRRADGANVASARRRARRGQWVRGGLRRLWAALVLAVIVVVMGVCLAGAVGLGAAGLYRWGQRAATRSSTTARPAVHTTAPPR